MKSQPLGKTQYLSAFKKHTQIFISDLGFLKFLYDCKGICFNEYDKDICSDSSH